MKRSIVSSLGLAALALPLVSGCYIGPDAATQTQGNSGNGTSVAVSGMKVDNATIVAGDPDSGKASFLATLYNPTDQEDELVSLSAGEGEATLLPEPVKIPPMATVTIQTGKDAQANFDGLEAQPGQYADVSLTFRSAGQADFPSLVVPPYGYYSDAAPEGTEELPEKVTVIETETVEVTH